MICKIVCIVLVLSSLVLGKSRVDIPINIGVGPAINSYNGIIGDDQLFHGCIKFDMYAVVDKEVISKNKKSIPAKYRSMASKVNEAHISKLYIPESIILSPKINNTALYGINFRPIGLSVSFVNTNRFKFETKLGLNITYLYIMSDSLFNESANSSNSMHFFRPGLDINPNFRVIFSKKINMSFGMESHFYIPQKVESGSSIFSIGSFDDKSLWNMNQIYLLFNYRFLKSLRF